jgi:uncharacterized protein
MVHSIIVKVATKCNMKCSYCYVSRNETVYKEKEIMSERILILLIEKVAEYCNKRGLSDFSFCWHGGEPLLAGYRFFEKVIELQKKNMAGIHIDNYIQTNGLLIDKNWIDIFKQYNYYTAISMDGTKDINDLRRKKANGQGTHDELIKKIEEMKKNDYPLKILSVVTPEAIPFGKEIYKYYRSLGCDWMDFLYPICNWIDNTFENKVEPKDLGTFLCTVFTEWLNEDNPNVYIRTFHDWCLLLMQGQPITCHSRNDCAFVITINTDGKLYICDDLLAYSDSYLGDIYSDELSSIENSKKLLFLSNKNNLLGEKCKKCYFFNICNGGCTLFRAKNKDDFTEKNYFCETQKMVIGHIRSTILSKI